MILSRSPILLLRFTSFSSPAGLTFFLNCFSFFGSEWESPFYVISMRVFGNNHTRQNSLTPAVHYCSDGDLSSGVTCWKQYKGD